MIDIENEVLDRVSTSVHEQFPDVYFSGEYVKAPASFPAVSLVEMNNLVYRRTQSSSSIENHVEVMYEANVYSNRTTGKKDECKRIASIIDATMGELGFTRMMLNPVPNMNDATIYRIVGRYKAVVSVDKTIYRR